MYAYYTRRSFRSSSEHLQRRSKYQEGRSTAYPSRGRNVRRDSRFANARARQKIASLPQNGRIADKATRHPPAQKGVPKDEEDISLGCHIIRIVRGIWKLFRDTPPRSRGICVVLGIVVLIILSFVMSIMVQLVTPLINLVYLIWGIMASVTAVEVWRQLERH